jgi:septal ring factor EnvC (AmiA/AmiB activator)
MLKFNKALRLLVVVAFVITSGMVSCTKRPDEEQLTKLEETRAAIESAQQKLKELREEAQQLESQLQQKQQELKGVEEERDDIKSKLQQKQSEQASN